jgi:hypothetical protein
MASRAEYHHVKKESQLGSEYHHFKKESRLGLDQREKHAHVQS